MSFSHLNAQKGTGGVEEIYSKGDLQMVTCTDFGGQLGAQAAKGAECEWKSLNKKSRSRLHSQLVSEHGQIKMIFGFVPSSCEKAANSSEMVA